MVQGKEETFQFLEAVLKEVMDLFPSDYIHIGGDEVRSLDLNMPPPEQFVPLCLGKPIVCAILLDSDAR